MAAAVAHGGFSTYRRAPRRLGCRRGVRSGPQRLHVAYRRGPWRLVFLINERKHTFAMVCVGAECSPDTN
jgi:hypothetical protein